MREAEAQWVWGIEARDCSEKIWTELVRKGHVGILALLRGRERPKVQKKDENINRSSKWWDSDYFILFSSCSLKYSHFLHDPVFSNV